MRALVLVLLALWVSLGMGIPAGQHPLIHVHDAGSEQDARITTRKLQGKFLHITDIHPDPYYKIYSSTGEGDACHRGKGPAGYYGAETTDCDSPLSLVNATFKWIEENIKDSIDFIIWTGDSARHDNDEKIPRSVKQVVSQNEMLVSKFMDVFGKGKKGDELSIPIVPTFGNNDILPHNIFREGPNQWTKRYMRMWNNFVPEEQRHSFERGGWFYVEVIPNKLAVFSLNSLYFFDNNAAVDGCSRKDEPGNEHMEWLRVQLGLLRERGVKAILTGHVPPARTDNKQNWDETCWQQYTLWLRQYRDVVLISTWGHMNIDHFMFHDSKEVDLDKLSRGDEVAKDFIPDDVSTMRAGDYLVDLTEEWAKLPKPPADSEVSSEENGGFSIWKKHGKKKKKTKYQKKIGGQWGERYSLSLVSPSVIPNYFPTLRVVEYNITGLEDAPTWTSQSLTKSEAEIKFPELLVQMFEKSQAIEAFSGSSEAMKKHKKKKGHKKKPKSPDVKIPDPPAKSAPPGPAYSPQPLTLLGYTQYYANLTYFNNDFDNKGFEESEQDQPDSVKDQKWKEGIHKGKDPHKKEPHPRGFHFDIEYCTLDDGIYKLKDMTVKSYLHLASRIGRSKPAKGDRVKYYSRAEFQDEDFEAGSQDRDPNDVEMELKDRDMEIEKKKKKHQAWVTFLQRAFVNTKDEEAILEQYG